MNGCEGVQAVHGRPSCLGRSQARRNYVSRSYRAVNTRLGYKNHSVNAVQGSKR